MSARSNDSSIATEAHCGASRGSSALPWVHTAVGIALLLPVSGTAHSPAGQAASNSTFGVSIVVRPEFRILASRPVKGGYEYRVWTNMRSMWLRGGEYRFDKVGEAVLIVPGELIEPAPDVSTLPPAAPVSTHP